MNPFVYLLFYSAIVIFLLTLFVRGSRRQDPSRLRFGPHALPPSSIKDVLILQRSTRTKETSDRAQRNLNVFFNYNGETFDAYEILGVPAGCSIATAREQYQTAFAAKSESERRLYDAALLALEKSKLSASSA